MMWTRCYNVMSSLKSTLSLDNRTKRSETSTRTLYLLLNAITSRDIFFLSLKLMFDRVFLEQNKIIKKYICPCNFYGKTSHLNFIWIYKEFLLTSLASEPWQECCEGLLWSKLKKNDLGLRHVAVPGAAFSWTQQGKLENHGS